MSDHQQTGAGPTAWRPTVRGTRHVIAAGHYLAAQAGFQVLEGGGNAIDAGVAAGITLGVVQSDFVNFAGVAPIMIYSAESGEVVTISGLGTWPGAATLDLFVHRYRGTIPRGLLRTVVPAAPDAWITALERYGTLSFAEVSEAAIRLAEHGFVMYPLMHEIISMHRSEYAEWPENAAIYLPAGRVPEVGECFVQRDLARTLGYMVDEERARRSHGRSAALEAARDAFYRGDIAKTITDYHSRNGGLLALEDLARFRVEVAPSVTARYRGKTVHTCPPWCQGPVLLQMLKLIGGMDIGALGHNTGAYVHALVEAMKLAFADRERYYADPRSRPVPLDELLSESHAAELRRFISREHVLEARDDSPLGAASNRASPSLAIDTSYVCAIDQHGNAFSATPSDVSFDSPVIPGTGLCPSSRGSQSWATPGHPCAVAPGRRPRLTPNPAILIDDETVMPFGTPGGDVQCQAMLQFLENHLVFGMPLQEAIEAPRFATHGFPDSFEPHASLPRSVSLETRIEESTGEHLSRLGHEVKWWPEMTFRAGGLCAATRDRRSGIVSAGADPRRTSYALGW